MNQQVPSITYAVVPHDGDVVVVTEPLTKRLILARIGSYGPMRGLPGPDGTTVYVNTAETDLPGNWVATQWMQPVLHPTVSIKGTVVVVGPANDLDGHPGDLPQDSIDALRGLNERHVMMAVVTE